MSSAKEQLSRLKKVADAARDVFKECVCKAEPRDCENYANLQNALHMLDEGYIPEHWKRVPTKKHEPE